MPVLPPDVNLSQLPFTVEPEGVRFGLTAVKNVGEGAILSILGVRTERGGRIDSLRTLCEHADLRLVNKRVLESLAKAGALDSLAPPDEPITSRRARLCAAIDRALEHGNRIQKDRDRGQTQLFDAMFGGERRRGRRGRRRRRTWRCPMPSPSPARRCSPSKRRRSGST